MLSNKGSASSVMCRRRFSRAPSIDSTLALGLSGGVCFGVMSIRSWASPAAVLGRAACKATISNGMLQSLAAAKMSFFQSKSFSTWAKFCSKACVDGCAVPKHRAISSAPAASSIGGRSIDRTSSAINQTNRARAVLMSRTRSRPIHGTRRSAMCAREYCRLICCSSSRVSALVLANSTARRSIF